jgi:hypothetical protein
MRIARSAPRTLFLVELIQDLGARTPRRAHPEIDDRCALGERLVLEDHDHVGVPDRGERPPEAVERPRVLDLGDQGGMRAEPLAQQLRERVRLLHGLGAGKRGDDVRAGRTEQALGLVERVVPRHRREHLRPTAEQRVGEAIGCVEV